MKDHTKYYIDLSKLSEVEVSEVEKRTTKCYYIKRAPFLHLFGKHWNQCMSESHSIKHKQELTYPEFIKLFEGGEVEKENIYEVNFDGYVKAQFKIVDDKIEIIQAMNGYGNSIPVSEITITNSNQ